MPPKRNPVAPLTATILHPKTATGPGARKGLGVRVPPLAPSARTLSDLHRCVLCRFVRVAHEACISSNPGRFAIPARFRVHTPCSSDPFVRQNLGTATTWRPTDLGALVRA